MLCLKRAIQRSPSPCISLIRTSPEQPYSACLCLCRCFHLRTQGVRNVKHPVHYCPHPVVAWTSSSLTRPAAFSCLSWPAAHTVVHPLQVNYKNVMKQYSLGPNGGILTSLNLFATRFDQVGQQRLYPLLTLKEPSKQAGTAGYLFPWQLSLLGCCSAGALQLPLVPSHVAQHWQAVTVSSPPCQFTLQLAHLVPAGALFTIFGRFAASKSL